MTPRRFTLTQTTPLGPVRLAASAQGLCGLWFEGQKHEPAVDEHWLADPRHPLLCEAARQLQAYFQGRLTRFELPLDLGAGTAFQQSVWQALLAVPHGRTLSYAELAARIGRPLAVRAVGAAVGRNPVSVVVPCHRIIGKAGALTGYAGGLPRKTALLQIERA